MTISLGQKVYQETDALYFPVRLYNSIEWVAKEKGGVAAASLTLALAISTITSLGLSYFCMEGVVRSFMAVRDDDTPIIKIRPLGDAGGWLSLIIFSTIALKTIINTSVREGESLKLPSIVQSWLAENKNSEDPHFHKKLSKKIHDLLDCFDRRRLFPRSLLSRRLTALEILQNTDLSQLNGKEKIMEDVLHKLHTKIEKKTSGRRYLYRVYEGEKSISEKGCCTQTISLIFGFALPLILMVNVVLSLTGEVGLGKELFVNRTELADTGHFGEWPINAIEAASVAYLLHLWYVINEGDFAITRRLYDKVITNFKGDPSSYNQLCKTANDDLAERAQICHYLKNPVHYKFEKL